MNDIICFGELLIRLSPALSGEWIRTSSMDCYIGGAELNVATALAAWKQPVRYVSALPDHYLSREIVAALTANGIDCRAIRFGGPRIGTYYLPQGADLKDRAVIYDRSGSSFSRLRPGEMDWEEILDGAGWLHISAISPALGEQSARICLEALLAASAKNITSSSDLNYRARLWEPGRSCRDTMAALMGHCKVVMGNIWSAHALLGIGGIPAKEASIGKDQYLDLARQTALEIQRQYPRCQQVAQTFRFERDLGMEYYAALDTSAGQHQSRTFQVDRVRDRVGSGDCFMAGIIYGIRQGLNHGDLINFAAGAAVGKFLEKGDGTRQTVEDIRILISQQILI